MENFFERIIVLHKTKKMKPNDVIEIEFIILHIINKSLNIVKPKIVIPKKIYLLHLFYL